MFLVVSRYLIPKGYSGMAIFPFVIFSEQRFRRDTTFVNHEKIHIRQQLELLVIPFFIWYFIEYLFRIVQYNDRYLAYKNISFEREAYKNEQHLDYLQRRSFWRFLKYI